MYRLIWCALIAASMIQMTASATGKSHGGRRKSERDQEDTVDKELHSPRQKSSHAIIPALRRRQHSPITLRATVSTDYTASRKWDVHERHCSDRQSTDGNVPPNMRERPRGCKEEIVIGRGDKGLEVDVHPEHDRRQGEYCHCTDTKSEICKCKRARAYGERLS